MEVFEKVVAFGPLRLDVTSRNTVGSEVVGIMAGDGDMLIAMERGQSSQNWRWSVTGKAGQAYGYMTAR